MSLKSIDTQLSLSRARDVGAIQNQINHKPSDDQLSLAVQAQKRMDEERKRLSQVSKTSEMLVKDQHSQNQRDQDSSPQSKDNHRTVEDSHVSDHPFKGHRIDISL